MPATSFHKFFLKDNGKHRNMDFGGKNDESTTNRDEAKQGRHDAHKHHDTMGEIIILGQELLDNVKDNHNGVDLVDNQVKEVNPHSESLDTHQIDEYDDCMDEAINIITAPLNI